MNADVKNILTIAGSDSSGGAGVQADLKTMTSLGAYGASVITALTAQNTQGVQRVMPVPADMVADQLHAVFSDIRIDAVKIGMLGDEYITRAVADVLRQYHPEHVVLDPVLVATSGDRLTSAAAMQIMVQDLVPLCTLITPNMAEASALLSKAILDIEQSAADLFERTAPCPVLLKGGDAGGDHARDILVSSDGVKSFSAPRVNTPHNHGTGCTLSSAIAIYLAQGLNLHLAVQSAKAYVTKGLETADRLQVGQGKGPLNHMHTLSRAVQ